jgi:dynein heavy chain
MAEKKQSLIEASIIDDMYELLAAYEVKIPTNDSVKLDDLHDIINTFEDSIEGADLHITTHKTDKMEDLDKAVSNISDELMTILGALHTDLYQNPKSNPTEVVESLTTINDRIQEIVELVSRYQGFQRLFKVRLLYFYNMIL